MNSPSDANAESADSPSAAAIRDRMVTSLQKELALPPEEMRTDEPLTSLGVDSMQFVGLVGELEEWLGCRILNNPLRRYPTIDALAEWLASERAAGHTHLDPNDARSRSSTKADF